MDGIEGEPRDRVRDALWIGALVALVAWVIDLFTSDHLGPWIFTLALVLGCLASMRRRLRALAEGTLVADDDPLPPGDRDLRG